MCTFTASTCSNCHKPVNIGSITSCGLMPEGMAVWFCPEMAWRSVDVVGSCVNCPEEEEKSVEGSLRSAETLVGERDLESLRDSGRRRGMEVLRKEEGIGSRRSSMDTRVNEEEDAPHMMDKESLRTSKDFADDESDRRRFGFEMAALVGMQGMVNVNGNPVNQKWENKRHEMIEDEKRRWSRGKQRRGCCVIQ